ncbi:MAG: ribosome maturation factor RimM [bacterium]|nr:ribosome maturation factor RimM [bacterium]
MNTDDLILIGKLTKLHGIKGMLKLASFAESIDAYCDLDSIYLKKNDGSFTKDQIEAISPHKTGAIVSLKSVKGIEDAQKLVGHELYIEKEQMKDLPAGEYYRYELIGLEVITDEGIHLGKIEDLLPTGSNDVFVVSKEGTENMIPATKEVIKDIDIARGEMIIRPLEKMIKDS